MAALIQLRRLFCSQVLTLGLEGLIIGYYVGSVYAHCRKNLEQEKPVSSLCPQCRKAVFQIICKGCSSIVSCGDCYTAMTECPHCTESIVRQESVVKIYMA